MAAHLLPSLFHPLMLAQPPVVREALTLTVGGCACDPAGRRLPAPEDDERALRARYRSRKVARGLVLSALDAHRRRAPGIPRLPGAWPVAFAGFVAEHARNAGPARFYLDFTADPGHPPTPPSAPFRTVTVAEIRAQPDTWLRDEIPMLVIP
jgi:hypothetical protein